MAKNQYEKRLVAVQKAMREHTDAFKAIYKEADDRKEQPTDEERLEIEEHIKHLETLKGEESEVKAAIDQIKRVDDINRELGPMNGKGELEVQNGLDDVQVVGKSPAQVKALGDQFLESKGYQDLMERGLSGEWSSGMVDLDTKAVLYTTPGSGLTPRDYQPGVVETLFQRLYVADLFGQVQTNASQITYISETTATNAAAAVAEGTAKPQSTLAFGETTEPVRKLATILPVSEEMLSDAPQIAAYINQRLTLFVKITEEQQLLLGTGAAPQIQGLIGAGRNSVGTYARSAGTTNELAILKAATGTRGSSFLEPDAVVMNPTNWLTVRAGTDASGQYYGGGPFYGPYGGPQGPASASHFMADQLWGMRVVVTSAMTVGSAVVGAFGQGGAVYRREGVRVEATNSHSTWFADNISAIRAEERLALAVYRQSAFTVVTGLN